MRDKILTAIMFLVLGVLNAIALNLFGTHQWAEIFILIEFAIVGLSMTGVVVLMISLLIKDMCNKIKNRCAMRAKERC